MDPDEIWKFMDSKGNKGKTSGGKSKKRKKSKSSPQAVSDKPNKSQCLYDLGISDIFTPTTPTTSTSASNGTEVKTLGTMASPSFGLGSYVPPYTMATMATVSPERQQSLHSLQPQYTAQYTPPPGTQPQPQPPNIIQQPPNIIQQANAGGQNSEQMINMSQLQAVLCRMESKMGDMDSKLKTLDSINSQVNSLNVKLSKFDDRVTSLETKLCETNSRLVDIEASRAFDSQTCDEIKKKCCDIENTVKSDLNKMQSFSKDFETIKSQNDQMQEEILDLQTRSMRDNVLVFDVEECKMFEK